MNPSITTSLQAMRNGMNLEHWIGKTFQEFWDWFDSTSKEIESAASNPVERAEVSERIASFIRETESLGYGVLESHMQEIISAASTAKAIERVREDHFSAEMAAIQDEIDLRALLPSSDLVDEISDHQRVRIKFEFIRSCLHANIVRDGGDTASARICAVAAHFLSTSDEQLALEDVRFPEKWAVFQAIEMWVAQNSDKVGRDTYRKLGAARFLEAAQQRELSLKEYISEYVKNQPSTHNFSTRVQNTEEQATALYDLVSRLLIDAD